MCNVETLTGESNIDLFPMGWLWARGCDYKWGEPGLILNTPTGRTTKIDTWGNLPYISRQSLQRLLKDLPSTDTQGRDGRTGDAVTSSARVARVVTQSKHIRESLSHLNKDLTRREMNKVVYNYRCLPEEYYSGKQPISPHKLSTWFEGSDGGPSAVAPNLGDMTSGSGVKLCELCSGSSVLSARARAQGLIHLPPADFRYGWSLARFMDQVAILYCLFEAGVDVLFMSPSCSPWDANSRALQYDKKANGSKKQ